jgi:hypothetical protein
MHSASGSQYSTAAPPVPLLPARMHRKSSWSLRAGNGTDGAGAAESCSGPSMNFQTNLFVSRLDVVLPAHGAEWIRLFGRGGGQRCLPWAAGRRRGRPASHDPRARASRLLRSGERQAGEHGPAPTVATVVKRRVRPLRVRFSAHSSRLAVSTCGRAVCHPVSLCCTSPVGPGHANERRATSRREKSGSPLPWRGT